LLLLALLPLAWVVRRRLTRWVWPYAGLVALTFVLLSALLQWKPTGARYHLAFFVLMAPFAGVVLEALPWKAAAPSAIGVLLLSCLPWLVGNPSRPLVSRFPGAQIDSVLTVPREEQYLANASYLSQPYEELAARIREARCSSVGLALPGQGLEYPLWALLDAPRSGVRIEWLVAGTASARYADPSFAPCAVVCEKCPDSWLTVRGLPEAYHFGSFRLFLEPPGTSSETLSAAPTRP